LKNFDELIGKHIYYKPNALVQNMTFFSLILPRKYAPRGERWNFSGYIIIHNSR
jgi:hypothetical protein